MGTWDLVSTLGFLFTTIFQSQHTSEDCYEISCSAGPKERVLCDEVVVSNDSMENGEEAPEERGPLVGVYAQQKIEVNRDSNELYDSKTRVL